MRVGVLTPMKPPHHPVPSGDRTFARLILAALARAGHEATLLSDLSTRLSSPDALPTVEAAAEAEVARLNALFQRKRPDALLTYHSYHKAPDLLGPRLARAFALPYAIVEASRAPRHATGLWARAHALADRALAEADALAAITATDEPALEAFAPGRVIRLPPFIDTTPFAAACAPPLGLAAPPPPPGDRDTPQAASPSEHPRHLRSAGTVPAALASAAMLREGRKAASVRLLADVFARVRAARPDATLRLAGDGPARPALEPLFPPGTLLGRLDPPELAALFARSTLFIWPALEEPFGFVFLEAQAAGLPVVACASRGVPDAVRDGETALLVPPGDADALAAATLTLLADPARHTRMATAARAFAATHDVAAGAHRLDALLARAVQHRAARLATAP